MNQQPHPLNIFTSIVTGAFIALALACTPVRQIPTDTIRPTPSVEEAKECVQGTSSPGISAAQPTCAPGLVLRGCVRSGDQNGSGIEGVDIYRGFASYQAVLVATTDGSGCYESEYQFIPGDEMVNVYAKKDGDTFEPASVSWRHYYGYEVRTIDFTAAAVP